MKSKPGHPKEQNLRNLEDLHSEAVLDWVKQQNQRTSHKFASDCAFKAMEATARSIYEDESKIPMISIGPDGYYYNFWQDENHTQGLWRRANVEEFCKATPAWEILLNLDDLPEVNNWIQLANGEHEEDEKWVWESVYFNQQGTRALISLSLGGNDATVVREFDLTTKTFVNDGFNLKEAIHNLDWLNDNAVVVASDFGKDSLTESGYPRIVKLWLRGEPLENAKNIYEGNISDVAVDVCAIRQPERAYVYVIRNISFYETEYFLLDQEKFELNKIPLPFDAELEGQFQTKIIIKLRTEWHVANGPVYKAGSVISVDLASIHDSMHLNTALVFEQTSFCSVDSIDSIKDGILITLLNHVCGELYQYKLVDNCWVSHKIAFPEKGSIEVISASADSNDALILYSDFLTPNRLYKYQSDLNSLEIVKQAQQNFDSHPMAVTQFESVSKDGTVIPYFVIHPKEILLDGSNPTLMYGYGGFEVSEKPAYLGAYGKLWLEKGGIYVVANIRGGGEFGPEWHQAALKENRHKSFEDFISVAEDLIARKITSPRHLGIMGNSNGGLLVGAAFTMRPELFNAVVCCSPLLDMLNYHNWLAGASWIAEYGDPENPEMRKILAGYSPYHQISPDQKYPTVLFESSTNDDRVHPVHARRMVEKMQAMGHKVYYFERAEGGHCGASNLKMSAFFTALVFSYLQRRLMQNQLNPVSALLSEHALSTSVNESIMTDRVLHGDFPANNSRFFQQLPPRVLNKVRNVSPEARESYDQRFGLVCQSG